MKNNKPNKFAGAGMLIGAGVQGAGSLINYMIKKQQMEELSRNQKEANIKSIMSNQNNQADAYSDYITQHPELVYGGDKEIQALGTDNMNLPNPNQVIQGGSHESGQDIERQNDFVEGGEVVRGEEVDSNRIEMFSPAQVNAGYSAILDEISGITNKLTGTNKGEMTRLIDKIQMKIDKVNQAQEAMKDSYGFTMKPNSSSSSPTGVQVSDKPKKAIGSPDLIGDLTRNRLLTPSLDVNFGITENDMLSDNVGVLSALNNYVDWGNIGGGLKKVAPYAADLGANVLDNIFNAKLLKQVPSTPKPIYHKALPLNTDIDVSDQISEARANRDTLNEFIDQSTASSSGAIQRKRAASNQATKDINRIRGEESRIETGLENQDIVNRQKVGNINADLRTDYRLRDTARTNSILQAKSENVSNLSRDLSDIANKYRLDKFQNEQLEFDAAKYGDIGSTATAAMSGAYDNMSNTWKSDFIKSIENVGRTEQANALRARWNV